MHCRVSIRIVLAVQSPSNHLSPLASFRSLSLPTILASWCQPGASAVENDSKKHLQTENLPDLSTTARLSSCKQLPNADVTITIWAVGAIKQHIVWIELLICDYEILDTAFAQKKKTLKKHRNLGLKGLMVLRLFFTVSCFERSRLDSRLSKDKCQSN